MKSEKSEKSIFAIFRLEPAACQCFPLKKGGSCFSDFSKNFRGYGGGVVFQKFSLQPLAFSIPALGRSQTMIN